jgi:hypothetical protein
MSDFIGIDITGVPELVAKLNKLSREVQDAITDDISVYMLNVLKAYPPQKSVSRESVYGETFFSDKQRRYFFAALADGRINVPYSRTQALAQGWKKVGSGYTAILANETPYAGLMMGEGEQGRMAKATGWKTTAQIVTERLARILEIADAGVKKAIKKLGL